MENTEWYPHPSSINNKRDKLFPLIRLRLLLINTDNCFVVSQIKLGAGSVRAIYMFCHIGCVQTHSLTLLKKVAYSFWISNYVVTVYHRNMWKNNLQTLKQQSLQNKMYVTANTFLPWLYNRTAGLSKHQNYSRKHHQLTFW